MKVSAAAGAASGMLSSSQNGCRNQSHGSVLGAGYADGTVETVSAFYLNYFFHNCNSPWKGFFKHKYNTTWMDNDRMES